MSTPVDIEPDEFYAVRHPLLAVAATFAALIAAGLALTDLFIHGFWPTVLHAAVGLAVFGLVRLAVGAALSTTFTSQADDGLDDTAPEASS